MKVSYMGERAFSSIVKKKISTLCGTVLLNPTYCIQCNMESEHCNITKKINLANTAEISLNNEQNGTQQEYGFCM